MARSLWLALLCACGNAHLKAGRAYQEQGQLGLAVEYFDAGVTRDKNDAELRDALILAEQGLHYELRRDVDDLKNAGRDAIALRRLFELEESLHRAARHAEPSEDRGAVEAERRALMQKTIAELGKSMDERTARGLDVKADLAACRELLAMVEDDPAVARTCDRLRSKFKVIALGSTVSGSDPSLAGVLSQIVGEAARRNPELLEIVSAPGRHNAELKLYLGAPRHEEIGYLVVQRDAFHRFVPVKDKHGRQVEETVTEQPTASEIEEAKRKKQPPPKAKQVQKKVWMEVKGEFRHYRATRSVGVPYRLVLESLRGNTVLLDVAGEHTVASRSEYHEYEGDARGRETDSPRTPYGKKNAAKLASSEQLLAQAVREAASSLLDHVLKRVE